MSELAARRTSEPTVLTGLRKALAIAGANLRRMVRYRANLFFMLLFPLLLILVIGAAFGAGFTPRLGVVVEQPGPMADRLLAALAEAEEVQLARIDQEPELRTRVERGELAGGLVVPAGYDGTVASGGQVDLRYLARPDERGQQLGIAVQAVVGEQGAVLRAARFGQTETGATFADSLATTDAVAGGVPPVTVTTTTVGEAMFPAGLGRFDIGASSQLLLFVFLTSLTGAVALLETRQLGITRRMRSSPTAVTTILAGEALGRIGIALTQGVLIMLGAALLFGVSWGDPVAAGVLLLLFALTASGAAMVVGSALRSEQQVVGVGLLLGLGLAALGGSMVPVELFSDTMRRVAYLTPHGWANDAFAELVRRGGGLVDVLPQLGVLAGLATGLFLLGAWLLRRSLIR